MLALLLAEELTANVLPRLCCALPLFRYLVNHHENLIGQVTTILGCNDDMDESVYKRFKWSMTKIHEMAKGHYHDSDFSKVDLLMHQLVFVLPPRLVGTYRAFNDVEGMCHGKRIILPCLSLLCSLFIPSWIVGRPIDDKYELVQKAALISDGVELKHSEKFGLHWHNIPPPTSPPEVLSGVPAGVPTTNPSNVMWVEAKELKAGEGVSLHCQQIMDKIAMQHNKATFAVYEFAVHGTKQKFVMKTNKRGSSIEHLLNLMSKASITHRKK